MSPPITDIQLSAKHLNDHKKIITTAWLGKDGQEKYEMTIHFGSKALSKYARGLDITECLPDINTMDWIELDLVNQTIEIVLK